MIINNNLSAMFARRKVEEYSRSLDKNVEVLSSGQKINRAGDNASDFAVSEQMRTQINGLYQAERNAQNGLSFIQVVEGSLGQVNDILQRIRTLAVQSANGIYSAGDRASIQVEVSQLVDEVDRISQSAEFNRLKLLDGNLAKGGKMSMFFHVGPNQNQRIRASVSTMSAASLKLVAGGKRMSIGTVSGANAAIGTVDQALNQINRQRAELGSYYNRMEYTIRALGEAHDNMQAAESRIRDADMASEVVQYTKNQILIQSGTAMLAHANFKPHLVLQLLG